MVSAPYRSVAHIYDRFAADAIALLTLYDYAANLWISYEEKMDITPKMQLFSCQAHGADGLDSHQWFLHGERLSANALGTPGWTFGHTRPADLWCTIRYPWKVLW